MPFWWPTLWEFYRNTVLASKKVQLVWLPPWTRTCLEASGKHNGYESYCSLAHPMGTICGQEGWREPWRGETKTWAEVYAGPSRGMEYPPWGMLLALAHPAYWTKTEQFLRKALQSTGVSQMLLPGLKGSTCRLEYWQDSLFFLFFCLMTVKHPKIELAGKGKFFLKLFIVFLISFI